MKKIYIQLLSVMMLCSVGAYSQTGNYAYPGQPVTLQETAPANVKTTSTKKEKVLIQKDFDNPIWTNDFSDPSDWIIGNDVPNDQNWVIGTDGPWGPITSTASVLGPLNSTTADNGYALFDSNGLADSLGASEQNAWIQIADPIDLSEETAVSIRFETLYAQWNGTCSIETSTNGLDWETAVNVFPNQEQGTATANPTVKEFPLLGLAGSSTAYIRFRYEGVSDYMWAIDDIAIATQPDYVLSLDQVYYDNWIVALDTINNSPLTYISTEQDIDLLSSYEYNRYQKDAVRPLSFTAIAANQGGQDLTGVTLNVTVTAPDSSTQTFSSAPIAIASNSTDTIVIPDQDVTALDLSGDNPQIGTYRVGYALVSNEADADSIPGSSFLVTEEVTANDRGDRINSIYSTLAENAIWANRMAFDQDQAVNFIQFAVTNLTSATQTFTTAEGQILFLNVGTGSPLGETGLIDEAFGDEEISYITNAEDISTAGDTTVWITAMLPETILLSADAVHQGEIHLPASADSIFVGIAGGQESYAGAVFDYGPDSGDPRWFTLGENVPMIRLGYNSAVGVDGPSDLNFKLGQNYPNPTTGQTQIDWELLKPAKNVTLRITDNTGKQVYIEKLGDRPAGVQSPIVLNLDLASGMYQYSLQVGNQRIVRKMTIVK